MDHSYGYHIHIASGVIMKIHSEFQLGFWSEGKAIIILLQCFRRQIPIVIRVPAGEIFPENGGNRLK